MLKFFLQIAFSVIVLANANPADYNEQYDDASTSISGESDENPTIIENTPMGVFTKYPDDPNDSNIAPFEYDLPVEETRRRRQSDRNDTDSSIDVSKQADKTDDVKRLERRTEEKAKVPLRGLIAAIESDLVSKAFQVNSQLRRRRSSECTVDDDDDDDNKSDEDEIDETSNYNTTDSSVDANQNFFKGLFNYTRPQRESEAKGVKIQLDALVQAVESTLVESSHRIKRNVSADESSKESSDLVRISRDKTRDDETKEEQIKVEKINATKKVDLNLLSPIIFKTVLAPEKREEEASSTTENPVQNIPCTNLTIIQTSDSVSLVPDSGHKLAHLQHQRITKTVFSSSLAIFPTIQPELINAPLGQVTSTAKPTVRTTVTPKSTNSKTDDISKHEQLAQKGEKLREEFAEIQEEPVILSQL